jgi:predicted house-cleaning noncanonical NTP pyrophosphatase (MazG superfamily)
MGQQAGKLVRDRIPDIIRAEGRTCVVETLNGLAYVAALRDKLIEEANEVAAASEPELAAELADVLEVLEALAAASGVSMTTVRQMQQQRRDERGGFERQIWLVSATAYS